MSYIPFPAGIKVGWGGTIASVPKGFLYCNGAAINRVQFANLFAAIATIWGTGDGSTTFNIPDCRNRVQMRADADTASGCPSITRPTSSVIGGALQCGGSASHCHNVCGLGHYHSYSGSTSGHSHIYSGSTDCSSGGVSAEAYFSSGVYPSDCYHCHYYSGSTSTDYDSFSGCTDSKLTSVTTDAATEVPPFAAFPEIIKV